MQKHRYRYRVGLGVLLWLGFCLVISVPQGRSGPLDDYTFTFGIWGNGQEESRMGREDLIAREGYCPTGGCVLRLDSVTVRPNQARRGDTLLLSTTYTILTPEQVAMPVAITREIFCQGKSLGRTKSIESRRLNGTWTQEIDFTLPATAAPGIYQLITKISTGYGTAQDRTDFQVD
ncbi:MAG: hypothetical protein WBV23_14210 [Desulfobaccales bacterium]